MRNNFDKVIVSVQLIAVAIFCSILYSFYFQLRGKAKAIPITLEIYELSCSSFQLFHMDT